MSDRPNHTQPATDGPLADSLLSMGKFLRRGETSEDLRAMFLSGGRKGDVFYRDRWSHDKVVRSTHGVNCTGSCSWKVYVKDGIITWETQQTDYPSVGPDSPEYEPRGCPRGAAFSWYTYSPTRVRFPYIRDVLADLYRAAKKAHPDPVDAWASIVEDPTKAKRYKKARGKGGLIRTTWDEALEISTAAQVYSVKKYGPDRIAGFSPIPAMSMVSHGAGSRYMNLIGGTMLSFYDWYADLPVASPQVFGDQTDVPESADWWNSQYLIMWGSNVPVTRTPDAHFMAEARYKGTKVVTVSPDYTDNTKFADEWVALQPGTDAALGLSMGHVILKEHYVEKRTKPFEDYMRTYTDSPFLVEIDTATGTPVPGKFLTAADLGLEAEDNADFKPALLDTSGTARVPRGTLGHRYSEKDKGQWNLDLGDITPALSVMDLDSWDGATAEISLPRFDLAPEAGQEHAGGSGVVQRGVPVVQLAGKTLTTVFDLMLAQYGVGRGSLSGQWPADFMDASTPGTPGWQEEHTGVPPEQAIRIAREFADTAEKSGGRSMILMGAGTNHWFHSDTIYRTFLALTMMTGCQGRQWRGLGPLRGPGKGPSAHRLPAIRFGR